jgi:outer membrane lipoprotein carrier protein
MPVVPRSERPEIRYIMRKIVSVVLIGFLSVTAFGQARDTKATQLLDAVSKKTKTFKSIKADFSYTMENKQANINEVKTGTLLVSGEKYRLTAAGQVIISNGTTLWTYIKESNEVQINDIDAKDDALTPSKLLTSYTENYKSKIIRDRNQTDPNLESVELIPNNVKNFTKAILVVDKVKLQVRRFIIFDKNGNTFTYKVTNYQTDVPVGNADFSFDPKKFPGVEIIDMR